MDASWLTFLLALLVGGATSLYFGVLLLSHAPRAVDPSELEFQTVGGRGALPRLTDEPETEISVVVPAYNEEKRLPLLLRDAVAYLGQHYRRWELLVVDDGSTDGTRDVCLALAAQLGAGEHVRYTRLVRNRGKGGAVSHGMRAARGARILFADADNASNFADLAKLEQAVANLGGKPSVAIGSRAHLVHTTQVIKRSRLRNFLMRGFHMLVYWFGIRTIRDTQCGFKLYTRDAAQQIFPYMHTEGWIFDVETLVLAMRKQIPVAEIPISWHEVDGSKIDLTRDSIRMAVDLVVIRFAYLFGIYKDNREAIKH